MCRKGEVEGEGWLVRDGAVIRSPPAVGSGGGGCSGGMCGGQS